RGRTGRQLATTRAVPVECTLVVLQPDDRLAFDFRRERACCGRREIECVDEEVRAIVDLEAEMVGAGYWTLAEPAQLRVLAVDIVTAGMRAHTEPSLRPPVRAHRPDEAADVLLRRRAVDLTRRNGAPAVQRIARGVQHVLEARAAIDVGRHTGHAGVVAARQAQTLTG